MCMNKNQTSIIRKLQGTLTRIAAGERFFFNITSFKRMGLIAEKSIYGKDSSGNKIRLETKYYLTNKGNMILNTQI